MVHIFKVGDPLVMLAEHFRQGGFASPQISFEPDNQPGVQQRCQLISQLLTRCLVGQMTGQN